MFFGGFQHFADGFLTCVSVLVQAQSRSCSETASPFMPPATLHRGWAYARAHARAHVDGHMHTHLHIQCTQTCTQCVCTHRHTHPCTFRLFWGFEEGADSLGLSLLPAAQSLKELTLVKQVSESLLPDSFHGDEGTSWLHIKGKNAFLLLPGGVMEPPPPSGPAAGDNSARF